MVRSKEHEAASKVFEEFKKVAEEFVKKQGYTMVGVRGQYNGQAMTFKVEFLTSAIDDKILSVDQTDLTYGLAKPGSFAWRMWAEDGEHYLVRILQARRRRYLFEWAGEEELGRFTAPFNGFRTHHPKSGQPAVWDKD